MDIQSDEPKPENNFLREWIHWIMGGLLAWGLLLGLGAYIYGRYTEVPTQPPSESVVVLKSKETRSSPPTYKIRSEADERKAILRGLIVATCATAFVTFWWAMLMVRERRLSKATR